MNILELDSYNLADAVKFNTQLNPRLWDKNEQLRPEVHDHLLRIADDFREFLGVSGYDLKDITISGSNAAYTYTPNSDIDLHLVVDLPEADASEVYRELFDAKKFQYNQQHNITIGSYPVELYVQDANKTHVSQGIYSVLNNQWIDVPKRRDAGVDDISTRSKYEDLAARIDVAVASGNPDDMAKLMSKIKAMRQAGLDQHGEFGADNLAFKMLRNQGAIKRLIDARNAARDQELSLREREIVVKQPFTYGFKTEDVSSNPNGVSPETKMFLSEKPRPEVTEIVSSFIDYCVQQLGIEQPPQVKFKKDPQWSARSKTFGRYNADHNLLEVSLAGRHVMDILRTVAHELTHTRQHEIETVPDTAGATGSRWENQANAQAGVLMRDYAEQHPEFFNDDGLEEDIRNKLATAALAACVAGAPGCATTTPINTGADAVKAAVRASQLTRAGLEHGVKQELKNVLRRGANANESSGYIPTKKQAKDPRFSMALTQDVRPGATGREANKLNLHTDSQGRPALLIKNLKNALREFKETGQLAEQDLFEINMSPTNLKKLAAQTGALAGMEFEMIVPGVDGGNDNDDLEPDYDYDERVTSIDDAVQFFNDGDYNGPREIRSLRDSMSDSYQEWLGEAWMEHFETYKTTIVFRFGKENWEEAQIAEIMGLDEAETEALETRGATSEDYMDAAEKVIEDGLDPWLNDAQEDAQEEFYDDHEEDWLRSQGLQSMSDIPAQYDMISWPYWTSGGDEGAGIESVADEFREAIGRKVNWSDSYHGGKREPNTYVVEPDGSLIPGDSDDAGLEFVSPPLPIDEMISDLNKVKAWADQRGCYTSKAAKTGLHINVSVPGFDNKKLDYVKLALLLGDEYVLNQFGRLGNSYAASAMGMIKERIAQRPADAAAMLQKMKEGMAELATKIIHSGTTSKFTSINTKDGYIEFRSPGGDWLDSNFGLIETTLMRFVVALDAAMDPAKYRDEYQRDLYKMLTGQQFGRRGSELEWDITSKAMVWTKDQRFARGKNAFTARQTPAFSTTVTAKTAKEAWEKAKPSPDAKASEYKIKPRSAASPDNDALLKIFSKWSTGEMSEAELSKGLKQAQLERNKVKDTYAELKPEPSNYKIYQMSDGRTMDTFYAADAEQARAEFIDWLMSPAAGGSAMDFNYAPINDRIRGTAPSTPRPRPRPDIIDIEPDVEQNFVPGSTLDLQRQRQQAAQQSATANALSQAAWPSPWQQTWAIKDSQGNTLHTFGGIGNAQADANRVAAGWLARAGYQDGLEVEVVPVMEPS